MLLRSGFPEIMEHAFFFSRSFRRRIRFRLPSQQIRYKMQKSNHPLETLVQTITCKGVVFEVVERPDVLWVGCVDYAENNTDESDIGAALKRYREELVGIPKQDLVHPDWSAALSINYGNDNKPCGLMFAQETYSDKQDERYDLFIQTGGLWLRFRWSTSAMPSMAI